MTDAYEVAIPSYRRAGTLREKTLPTLARNGVPAARVTVWVADAAEQAEYRRVLDAGTYATVEVAAPTLRAARNHIHRQYPAGSLLLEADDDLSDLYWSADRRTRVPLPGGVPALVADLGERLHREGVSLAGVHPVDNPYFHRPGTTTDLRYIVGALFLLRVERAPWMDVSLEDKEDFERTVLHFLAKGAVLRRNDVAFRTRYYKEPGGMQATRTEQRVHDSAVALHDRYPDLLRLRRSAQGHTEVAFRRLR